jgi:hypothetical protein
MIWSSLPASAFKSLVFRGLVAQALAQPIDRLLQVGQIMVDGGLQDRVGCVEVAVSQVIAHAGDLAPGDRRFSVEQVAGSALTASPISSSRIRTASKTSPSDKPVR